MRMSSLPPPSHQQHGLRVRWKTAGVRINSSPLPALVTMTLAYFCNLCFNKNMQLFACVRLLLSRDEQVPICLCAPLRAARTNNCPPHARGFTVQLHTRAGVQTLGITHGTKRQDQPRHARACCPVRVTGCILGASAEARCYNRRRDYVCGAHSAQVAPFNTQ